MNDGRSPVERLVTVPEAAEILGISPEAVRARLNRGTLPREKGPDGTTYVRLNADRMRSNGDRTSDQAAAHSLLLARLENENEYLRRQLDQEREANRENRRIIAGLVQRVPELEHPRESAPEPSEPPTTPAEPRSDTQAPQEEERRSWWRRWLGG